MEHTGDESHDQVNNQAGEHAADAQASAFTGLREADGRLILSLRVTTRASRDALAIERGQLRVWLRASPVDGAANAALIALLAERLDLPKSAITLIRGAAARNKQAAITGLAADEARRRLATPSGSAPS